MSFSSFQNLTFTWTLLGVMGFQRAGHHKWCLKLRKGVSWVGGTPVVYLLILESPFSVPRVTCFRMDFWPCCVAPQVSGGQQSRQLQVAQSCVARRWHLREPANGATGDDLWKQDVTTRQPIIYILHFNLEGSWIFDDSIYFSLLDLTGTSETKHQWHQMISLKILLLSRNIPN